jgi:hypothetical protein
MSNGKAPNMMLLASSGAAYGAINGVSSDFTASVASLLTGTTPMNNNVTSSANVQNLYNGPPSFLQKATSAGLLCNVVASYSAFSGTTYASTGQCQQIGVLDAECIGAACESDGTFFCNARTKVPLCNGPMALQNTSTVFNQFTTMLGLHHDLLYVQFDAFQDMSNNPLDLSKQAAISLLDGLVAQIAILSVQRSGITSRAFLIMVTGVLTGDAFFAAGITGGRSLNMAPLPNGQASVLSVAPNVYQWLQIPAPSTLVAGSVAGICTTGGQAADC